ncbi:hypothetical protein GGI06_000803 [Coemansia sp. S85]|nr:hypothetical protein GGI06_000803 [Coemansia sp. S85]
MFGVRGFALVMLGKRRPFAVEDIRDPAEEEEFYQKSKRLCDDRSKRNSRRLVLVALLTLVNRDSSELGMLEVGLLFAVWQLLVLRTPIRRHFDKLQIRASKRKQELINSKLRAVYANSRRQTVDEWWLKSRVRELVKESASFASVISMAVAQILNAWVTANKIGWRALVPVVVAFTHWICSHLVAAKVEQLREQNQVDAKPAFCGHFSSTLQNIRTVKFYAWEDIFGNDFAWSSVPRYELPMVWRALQFGLDLVGCATAELSAALAITSYISTAGSISYLDVTLLISSIGPLTSFTTTLAGLNKRLTNFKTTKAELQEFFDADSANYIDRSLVTGELAVDLEECVFSAVR